MGLINVRSVRHTVEVERMADSCENDTVGNLCQEVVLEERVIHYVQWWEAACCVACRFETNELWNGNLLFKPRETAWGQVELLRQNSLVHETVPVHPGLHVTFPLVEVDIMIEDAHGKVQTGARARITEPLVVVQERDKR